MRQPLPFGKYLLLERISVGGMAEVFKAKAFGVEGFEKILAIKRILPSMAEDADFIQMFIDEAKIAGQLNHANIAQIFELGRVDDSHFIAMEYVWGKDLLQMQNRFRRMKMTMPFAMAAYCTARVCEGLDYAHKKKDATGRLLGIIHRDVSPQNVLCSYDGEIKVIDFGIAKAASRSTKTQAGVLKGKFGYMSPEQVRGLPLDRRSDIFAIATILYELLTAERLFLGESDFATLEKVRNVDVPAPSKVIPNIPPALEAVILRGLAKDAEDRYQWASEMQEDLHAYLGALEPPYGVKQLAVWMREQFAAEIKRESQLLDQQKKMTRDIRTAEDARALLRSPQQAANATPPTGEPLHDGAGVVGEIGEIELPLLQGEATQISTELPPEVAAVIAARDAEGQNRAIVGQSTQILDSGSSAPLGGLSTQILDSGSAAPLGGLSTQILDTGSAAPLAGLSTQILDTSGPGGNGFGAIPGQSTVILEAPVYPAPQALGQLGRNPPSGQTGQFAGQLARHPGSGQTGMNPSTSQVTNLPYAARRSSLARDLLIGAIVAIIVVGGVLGGRHLMTRRDARSTLVLTVSPAASARLYVDGVERGLLQAGAPLTLKDLTPGPHDLKVKGEEGGSYEQQVVMAANDVSVVQAILKGLQTPLVKPSGGGTGRFLLQLQNDGATVLIDGAQLDDGSWKDPIPLRAGTPHEFRISKPKFEEQRFSVTLQPGEDRKRTIELKTAVGHLEVLTSPSGAEVNVNGKSAGKTPVKVDDLDMNKDARVTVRLRGYASVTKYVSFERDNHQSLDLKLASAQPGKEDEEGRKAAEEERKHEKEHPTAEKEKGEKGEKGAVAEKGEKEKGVEQAVSEVKNAVANPGDSGFLVANTQPWAKVYIDGKDTGKTTPIAPRSKIPLKPGKHVVTFVANGKRYNFDVMIKPGEDFRLIRQLDQP